MYKEKKREIMYNTEGREGGTKMTNTKQAIAESLKHHLLRKPITKITINDITEDCGISRMTFYYHFNDIYDLVEWVCTEEARAALESLPGVTVMDDPANNVYPMPALLAGTDDVYVGRLRKDPTVANGLQFWCVGDQIRKGAALNATQIARLLLPTD